MKIKKILLLLLLFLGIAVAPRAQQPSQPLFSVLTSTPGNEAYSIYGHTALRMQWQERGVDVTFNYGIFNFNAPHFLWRFVLGQTDYCVMGMPTNAFLEEYAHEGRGVEEQYLDLSAREAESLLQKMIYVTQPRHSYYRYNFLTQNCATKVLDAVRDVVQDSLVYIPATHVRHSYRSLLHRYTASRPWLREGADLLLGSACDTLITERQAAFLPQELMRYLSALYRRSPDGRIRPLVCRHNTLLSTNAVMSSSAPCVFFAPHNVALGFVLFCLFLIFVERRLRSMLWGIDALLLTFWGSAGLLVSFVCFFSAHPTVQSNWQVLLLNPLPLFLMPWIIYRARQRRFSSIHVVLAVSLLGFALISAWISQKFAEIIVPLAIGLALRSVSYIYNKEKTCRKE